MKPFTYVRGAAVPLPVSNIDTDVIIRVERMTGKSEDAMRKFAFEALRYHADGSENGDCPLNQPAYAEAPILITGANFGCGSSREPAVWAIMSLGIRCIIAESFGDIFQGNCFQNGLLAIALPAEDIQALAGEAATPGLFGVNLLDQYIEAPSGRRTAFAVDPLRKESLVEGLDELEQTRKWGSLVQGWQHADRARRPWVWSAPTEPLPPGVAQ